MDPKWWYRGGLLVVLVAFFLLIARGAFLAFKPEATRVERFEARAFGKPVQPDSAAATGAPAAPGSRP
jgi:hypothetical protein